MSGYLTHYPYMVTLHLFTTLLKSFKIESNATKCVLLGTFNSEKVQAITLPWESYVSYQMFYSWHQSYFCVSKQGENLSGEEHWHMSWFLFVLNSLLFVLEPLLVESRALGRKKSYISSCLHTSILHVLHHLDCKKSHHLLIPNFLLYLSKFLGSNVQDKANASEHWLYTWRSKVPKQGQISNMGIGTNNKSIKGLGVEDIQSIWTISGSECVMEGGEELPIALR